MTREERKNVLHCLKVMAEEEVCEECDLYGTTGTDHCEEDCVRMAIQALSQEPCEDWYDVPSDEMTLEQARQAVKDLRKKLAEYLDQQPCDDAISRILKRMWNCRGKHTTSIDKVAMEQIIRDELPSVTHKSGKWITTRTFMHDGEYYCDRCKCEAPNNEKWDYCPNCGARMVEPQERSE